MRAQLTIRLFGPLEATVGGEPLPRLRTRKGELLLALLVLRHDTEVSRDWLTALLWPDSTPENMQMSLRQALHDLRRASGAERDRIKSPSARSLRFCSSGADIDLVEFDRLAALRAPTAADLDRLIALHRAPLLEGVVAECLTSEREHRLATYVSALDRRAAMALDAGDARAAIVLLRRAVATAPLEESLHRSLMRSLATDGDVPAAMLVYRDLRVLLWEQMRLEPDAETRALFAHIRAEARQPAKQAPPAADRFAGRSEPPDAPTAAPPPLALTALLGRQSELAEADELLERGRLVTITGMGGIGKTRLALEIAARWSAPERASHGVAYVALESLTDPELLAAHIAERLGAPPAREAGTHELIARCLESRISLLILDNCEHLVAACAHLAATVLAACPELRILATSRVSLSITGELVLPLQPLETPAAEMSDGEAAGMPALRLFVERAQAADPRLPLRGADIGAIARICRALDGIPLAIELAAARLRSLTLEQIVESMDSRFTLLRSAGGGRPGRSAAMEASIDVSFKLLSVEDRAFFCSLCVFVGGFTLESVAAVYQQRDALDAVTRLLESSLIVRSDDVAGASRFTMLETVRQFGLQRLEESGRLLEAVRAHASAFLSMAERGKDELMGPNHARWLTRLDADQANMRAALQACDDHCTFVRLACALYRYWALRSHLSEAARWLDQAVDRSANLDALLAARAHNAAGAIAWQAWNAEKATCLLERAAVLAEEAGDQQMVGHAQNNLALAYQNLGEYAKACAAGREAVSRFRSLADGPLLGAALGNLGRAALKIGRLDEAGAALTESLQLLQAQGDSLAIAVGQLGLADLDLAAGRIAGTAMWLVRSMGILNDLGDRYRITWCYETAASSYLALSDFTRCAYFKGLARAQIERIGMVRPGDANPEFQRENEAVLAALGPDTLAKIMEETRSWDDEQAVRFAIETCSALACSGAAIRQQT